MCKSFGNDLSTSDITLKGMGKQTTIGRHNTLSHWDLEPLLLTRINLCRSMHKYSRAQ